MHCSQSLSFALFPAFLFPCFLKGGDKPTSPTFHLHSVEMIAVSLPSPPFCLQLIRKSHAELPAPPSYPHLSAAAALNPNRWRHHPQKGVTIHLKRGISLRPLCVGGSNVPGKPPPPSHLIPLSPLSAIVDDFYSSLNEKNLNRLHGLIADDCVFEDLAFPKPFKGKNEVRRFLKKLTEAMGKDMRFIIDSLYEGRENNIAVRWHLEWKQRHIPLAKGCSFYYCATNKRVLLIKSACVFVESPLKPGQYVLELLKIISTLLDKFPKQANWFLEKHHVMVQLIAKAYKIFIEPLILPLLMYHTNLWTYGARILRAVLNLLQKLLKILMW